MRLTVVLLSLALFSLVPLFAPAGYAAEPTWRAPSHAGSCKRKHAKGAGDGQAKQTKPTKKDKNKDKTSDKSYGFEL
ncbi:MAG: hypothetical protein ABSB49_19655 [Polyangia bacterium]|jgi:hypothetical protein